MTNVKVCFIQAIKCMHKLAVQIKGTLFTNGQCVVHHYVIVAVIDVTIIKYKITKS